MKKSMEDLLREGYLTWRKNLILGLPPLLKGIFMIIAIVFATLCFIAAVIFFFVASMADMEGGVKGYGNYSAIYSAAIPFVLALAAIAAFFAVFVLLVNAFFTSASVGMSLKALDTGKTDARDIVYYGKRYVWPIFSASILIILINAAGLLLLVPAVAAFAAGALNVGLSLLVMGIAALFLYATLAGFLFILTPYAIVAGDLGAVEGIKTSYSTVLKNKLPVVMTWFAAMGLETGFGIAVNVVTSGFAVMPLVGMVMNLVLILLYTLFSAAVLAPTITLWWTGLYKSMGAKVKRGSHHRPSQHPSPEPPVKQPEIYM